ncbi:MAG: hypothetical protein M3016_02255 [Actinomycetota bacterium]|nr:hypothetical protein [Actinomycetota bacterium]
MSGADVCAVIYGAHPASLAAGLVRAVSSQSIAPDRVLREAGLSAAVAAGAACPATWLWLVHASSVPRPDALAQLLDAADSLGEPAPLLLSSCVLDETGQLRRDAIPRHEVFEKEHSVQAIEHRLVQLRTASHGSVLVASHAVARVAPPRTGRGAGLDMLEWSARVLRRPTDTGYLVPASVVVRTGGLAAHPGRELTGRARLLLGEAWRPTEKLWEALQLGLAAAEVLRSGMGRCGSAGLEPVTQPTEDDGQDRNREAVRV